MGIAERLKLEGLIKGEQDLDLDDGKTEYHPEEISKLHNNFVVSNNENQITKDLRKTGRPVKSVQSSNIQSLEQLDQKVEESYSKDFNGSYVCNHCAKSYDKRCNIKEHVEIHFEGLTFPCTFCDTILRSRHSLRVHTKRQH